MPARPPDDRAFSPVVAVAIITAVTVILAGSAYVWASRAQADDAHAANAVVLVGVTAVQGPAMGGVAGQWKNLSVAQGPVGGASWSTVRLLLDGAPLPCSDSAAAQTSFRVYAGGAVAPCAGVTPPDVPLAAGDVLEVWSPGAGVGMAPPLAGRTLTVIDARTNTAVLTVTIR